MNKLLCSLVCLYMVGCTSNSSITSSARVYFYREDDAISGPSVNIFVSGNYLTSLLDGSYRAANVCATNERLFPSFTRKHNFTDRDLGIAYNLEVGKTFYVKVIADAQGQPVFQRVEEQEGRNAIRHLDHKTGMVPRTKENNQCAVSTPAKPAPEPEKVLEKITLNAHSLFKFDKSDYENMLEKGREEIKEVGAKINARGLDITGIKVVGYTDPMGDYNYNMHLSKARANTVKKALEIAGVQVPITASGQGENNLVVEDCSKKYRGDRKARMLCDQPNRRVEILLYGNQAK